MYCKSVSHTLFLATALATTPPLKTSVVSFGNNTGTPQHLASGTLYGIPQNPNQIPERFYSDIAWGYERAGGSQLPAPALGWLYGVENYKNRFASAVESFNAALSHGGKFVLLISDVWGADGSTNASSPWPGDNDNWTYWDEYLEHLLPDMRAAGMNNHPGSVFVDLWNEPDLVPQLFWNRSQEQYLQMWGRTYHRFREAFGDSVLLSGPATANEPLANNTWWSSWAQFVARNQSGPDQYVWHMEGGGGDLLSAQDGLVTQLESAGLPRKQVNINEYATFAEQIPAGSMWWVAQLERIDALGLRGNWLSGLALHDFLASLVSKPGAENNYNATEADYYPNGAWQAYSYYAMNMTGHRVGTMPSGDLKLDTYATVEPQGKARVLAGVRLTNGTWYVSLSQLEKLGLPESGELEVEKLAFPVAAADPYYGYVAGPTSLGSTKYQYSGGELAVPVHQTDNNTAYAFEFETKQ